MQDKFHSTIDVARLLGVPEHRLVYSLRAGKLKEPEHRVAGKRIFNEDEIRRIAAYFGVPVPEREVADV